MINSEQSVDKLDKVSTGLLSKMINSESVDKLDKVSRPSIKDDKFRAICPSVDKLDKVRTGLPSQMINSELFVHPLIN